MQEIERIKNGWKQFRVCCSEDFAKLIDHIDKLEAENERLRKDAERRPMTDEEIQSAWDMAVGPYGHVAGLYKRGIARAVEAFHGIKGTP